jgi:transcriptional regulator with XRE-family HTH domain
MNFHEELRSQREKKGLTIEQAAERFHLSEMAYKDRENNRVEMKVPERCGLLVGLGMSFDEAVRVASEPDSYEVGGSEMQAQQARRIQDPFVRETDDAFVLVNRDHDGMEYTILKERVRRAEDILGWVDHLGEKVWVTSEHLLMFVTLTSAHLGLRIHSV